MKFLLTLTLAAFAATAFAADPVSPQPVVSAPALGQLAQPLPGVVTNHPAPGAVLGVPHPAVDPLTASCGTIAVGSARPNLGCAIPGPHCGACEAGQRGHLLSRIVDWLLYRPCSQYHTLRPNQYMPPLRTFFPATCNNAYAAYPPSCDTGCNNTQRGNATRLLPPAASCGDNKSGVRSFLKNFLPGSISGGCKGTDCSLPVPSGFRLANAEANITPQPTTYGAGPN